MTISSLALNMQSLINFAYEGYPFPSKMVASNPHKQFFACCANGSLSIRLEEKIVWLFAI